MPPRRKNAIEQEVDHEEEEERALAARERDAAEPVPPEQVSSAWRVAVDLLTSVTLTRPLPGLDAETRMLVEHGRDASVHGAVFAFHAPRHRDTGTASATTYSLLVVNRCAGLSVQRSGGGGGGGGETPLVSFFVPRPASPEELARSIPATELVLLLHHGRNEAAAPTTTLGAAVGALVESATGQRKASHVMCDARTHDAVTRAGQGALFWRSLEHDGELVAFQCYVDATAACRIYGLAQTAAVSVAERAFRPLIAYLRAASECSSADEAREAPGMAEALSKPMLVQ